MFYGTQFSDHSKAGGDGHTIISYLWGFGDHSTNSIEREPCHTYNHAGVYTISLTVTNDCGKSETHEKTITLGGDGMTTYVKDFIISSRIKISVRITTRELAVPITLLNAGSGEGLSNEEVELLDTNLGLLQTGETDANGKVSFANLAHGKYYIQIGDYTQKIEVNGNKNKNINVAKLEQTIEVEFTDEDTEEPLTNKKAELLNRDHVPIQETVTNVEGIAIFTNVPHGRYSARLTY